VSEHPIALHSRYGPSKAAQWMACPGSIAATATADVVESSTFADEGTAAHELAAMARTEGQPAAAFVGRVITVKSGRTFEVDDEMAAFVQQYLDTIDAMAVGMELMVEQRVEHGAAIGLPGEKGTADTIAYSLSTGELQVHDLKYGRGVFVAAEGNEQMLLYALGAMYELEMVGEFETVRMVIHQPRLDYVGEWVQTREEMDAHVQRFRRGVAATLEPSAPRVPGEKQCRFCAAKATCPEYRDEVAEFTTSQPAPATPEEFAELTPDTDPSLVEDEWLAVCMSKVELIESWCKAVRGETERRMLAGKTIRGFKLVQGRRGARRWSDAAQAEEALRAMRVPHDRMFDYSLISPATAEKLAKEGVIGPRQWPKLGPLITQPEGGISVAPESDKRPAVTGAASAEEFALTGEEGLV
jgi:hypothetical protein